MSVDSDVTIPSHNGGVPKAEYENVEPTIDALSFTLDLFIDAIVDDTSRYHEFAHFINEWPHFYDRFISGAMKLFDVSMLPVAESGVCITKEYTLGKLYTMESYLDMTSIPKEETKNRPRYKERCTSQQYVSLDSY
jgi:hypothetical protein